MLKTYALLLGLVIALVAISAAPAGALPCDSAVYTAIDEVHGTLAITSIAGTSFVVLGEQPAGNYLPVANGSVPPSGALGITVPHTGPTQNNIPQYKVLLSYPGGGGSVMLASGGNPGDDDRWWLD